MGIYFCGAVPVKKLKIGFLPTVPPCSKIFLPGLRGADLAKKPKIGMWCGPCVIVILF